MSKGTAIPIDKPPVEAVSKRTDTFPDGSRDTRVDVADRTMSILDLGADEPREVYFEYESSGVNIYTITARWPMRPNTPAVRDMVVADDGLVYGVAEPNRVFVLDPEQGIFTRDESWTDYGKVSGYQAPRCMTVGPDGKIYALFREAVVRIEPGTLAHQEIARPNAPSNGREISVRNHLPGTGPSGASHKWFLTLFSRATPITSGIAIVKGRLYFGSGPRLLSCGLGL